MGLKSNSKKGYPLSRYFKDLNESDLDSDSENSSDDDQSASLSQHHHTHHGSSGSQKEETNDDSDENVSSNTSLTPKEPVVQKLPSARDCFGNKSNPTFLNLDRKKEIDWDQSTNLKLLDSDSDQVIDYKTNAVPPPASYEPVTDSSIKVVDSEGNKRKSSGPCGMSPDLEDAKLMNSQSKQFLVKPADLNKREQRTRQKLWIHDTTRWTTILL